MWSRIRARSVSRSAGAPSLPANTQAGVWLCQTSVWPTTNIPFFSPKATYRSAGSKSYRSGSGWTSCHFNRFSGLIVLKCRFTISALTASFSSVCGWLSAAPMSMPFGARFLSAGGSAARTASAPAASVTDNAPRVATTESARAFRPLGRRILLPALGELRLDPQAEALADRIQGQADDHQHERDAGVDA